MQSKRHALGQHFLKNEAIAQQIAQTILQQSVLNRCSTLLEIGPGKGALTFPILKQWPIDSELRQFCLVERDLQFVQDWKSYQDRYSFLNVQEGDFLKLEPQKWMGEGSLAVVSNLPYSVGTAILLRLVEAFEKIPVMVLMFQAEVAQRIRAEAHAKARGSLSLWIQNRWDVQKLVSVPPLCFSPPPQVDSEVLLLTRRRVPQIVFEPSHEGEWQSFLKICFSHQRKMLRSYLPWKEALRQSGVEGTKRAEALDWEEWRQLFQCVQHELQSIAR